MHSVLDYFTVCPVNEKLEKKTILNYFKMLLKILVYTKNKNLCVCNFIYIYVCIYIYIFKYIYIYIYMYMNINDECTLKTSF